MPRSLKVSPQYIPKVKAAVSRRFVRGTYRIIRRELGGDVCTKDLSIISLTKIEEGSIR